MKAGKILILGAGKFGTCLAQHLASLDHDVSLYCRRQAVAEEINKTHQNTKAHPNTVLNSNIHAIHQLTAETLSRYTTIVNAVPVQQHNDLLTPIAPGLTQEHLYISVSKGIESETGALPRDILAKITTNHMTRDTVILFGPSFAEEVLAQQPTALVAASENLKKAELAQALFHGNFLRVYTSEDPLGLEVAGALKNVIAIAAGAADGLGFKSNARAALITRGLNEILKIGLSRGANPMTFLGLGGVGDLLLTCGSVQSRNYQVGQRLGQDASLAEAIKGVGSVAEGVYTAKAAYKWVKDGQLNCPIIQHIYAVLYEGLDIKTAVHQLLHRPSAAEIPPALLAHYFFDNLPQ